MLTDGGLPLNRASIVVNNGVDSQTKSKVANAVIVPADFEFADLDDLSSITVSDKNTTLLNNNTSSVKSHLWQRDPAQDSSDSGPIRIIAKDVATASQADLATMNQSVQKDGKHHFDEEDHKSFGGRDVHIFDEHGNKLEEISHANIGIMNDEDKKVIQRAITIRLIEIIRERQLKKPEPDKSQEDKLHDNLRHQQNLHKIDAPVDKTAERDAIADQRRAGEIKRGIVRQEIERTAHQEAVQQESETKEYIHALDDKQEQIKQRNLKESIHSAEEAQNRVLERPRLKSDK